MTPEIFITSKVRESFGITFPPSSLDAIVIGNLLEVEKLLGYKPDAEVVEHFMYCIQ